MTHYQSRIFIFRLKFYSNCNWHQTFKPFGQYNSCGIRAGVGTTKIMLNCTLPRTVQKFHNDVQLLSYHHARWNILLETTTIHDRALCVYIHYNYEPRLRIKQNSYNNDHIAVSAICDVTIVAPLDRSRQSNMTAITTNLYQLRYTSPSASLLWILPYHVQNWKLFAYILQEACTYASSPQSLATSHSLKLGLSEYYCALKSRLLFHCWKSRFVRTLLQTLQIDMISRSAFTANSHRFWRCWTSHRLPFVFIPLYV